MALPSLVDINVPEGKHFTVCGDVHGQVIYFASSEHMCLVLHTFSLIL